MLPAQIVAAAAAVAGCCLRNWRWHWEVGPSVRPGISFKPILSLQLLGPKRKEIKPLCSLYPILIRPREWFTIHTGTGTKHFPTNIPLIQKMHFFASFFTVDPDPRPLSTSCWRSRYAKRMRIRNSYSMPRSFPFRLTTKYFVMFYVAELSRLNTSVYSEANTLSAAFLFAKKKMLWLHDTTETEYSYAYCPEPYSLLRLEPYFKVDSCKLQEPNHFKISF